MEQKRIPPLGVAVRLGSGAFWTLISGFLLILAAWLFITFLWFADESNPTWRQIVTTGWLTRSITISAFAIRWAAGAQAVFFVSMIAAIVLERAEAPLALAPSISMTTVNGVGLWEFLLLCFKITRAKMILAAAVLMVLVSGLLQFTSTALLSDIGTGLVSVNITTDRAFTLSPEQSTITSVNGHYLYRQPSFPAFAELKPATGAKLSPGVVDTGPSLRAFLPISESTERDLTREYSGPAHVFDTRVVCARPSMQDIKLVDGVYPGLGLQGQLGAPEADIDRFTHPTEDQNLTAPFLCSIPFMGSIAGPQQMAYLPLSFCPIPVNARMGYLASIMREDPEDDQHYPPEYLPFLVLSTQDHSQKWTGWHDLRLYNAADTPLNLTSAGEGDPDSPWVRIDTAWANASVIVTQCFTSINSQAASIRAWRAGRNGTTEPSSKTTKDLDTTKIRRQLGVNGTSSPSERGIFQLEDKQSWIAYAMNGTYLPSIGTKLDDDAATSVSSYLRQDGTNFTDISQVWSIKIGYSDKVSEKDIALGGLQAHVVSDTFQTTSNPALALQAFLTMQLSLAYYEFSDFFDLALPATSLTDRSVLVPVQKIFYAVISVGVLLHILLVVAVAVAFTRGTRWITLGSAWQSLAQMSSQDLQSCIADKTNVVNDAQVAKQVHAAGLQSVVVRSTEAQGRIQIVRRRWLREESQLLEGEPQRQ